MKTISEIKSEFETSQNLEYLISQYQNDTRKGVQNIIHKYQKKIQEFQKEQLRLDTMLTFEKECYICFLIISIFMLSIWAWQKTLPDVH